LKRRALSVILIVVFVSACAEAAPTVLPTASPVPPTVTPTFIPTETAAKATIIPSATPELPDYTGIFLDHLSKSEDSCMPDKTGQCVSLYVYDLDQGRELVAINEDVPLQYASAFKGPVLAYFLQNCKKYWDIDSAEWNDYFLGSNPVDPWYGSDDYRQLLSGHLSDVTNWNNLDTFFFNHRASTNGVTAMMDERYLILQQVYKMVTQSNNIAAGNVLKFVYENCLPGPSAAIEQRCGGSNAITEFNLWFNDFSGIIYAANEPRRGLNSWDVIITTDSNGYTQVTRMPTYGLMDQCATQIVLLGCADNLPIPNVWTARDFFEFYFALFHLENVSERTVALEILAVDDPGASRGYLKNMAREMGATPMSKNGYFGSIIVDAGIVTYQGRSYIIAVLSYNAVDSIVKLFGQYDSGGNLAGPDTGLLQKLLEGTLAPK
jgi:hypothetical protein